METLFGLNKDFYLQRIEQLWQRRDVSANADLLLHIIQQRFCVGCHTAFTNKDPRIQHCSRTCAQRRRWKQQRPEAGL